MARVKQQWPDVVAMLVADVVHREPVTGKFTILGTYSVIGATGFPCTHPVLCVYLALTDGHGKTTMRVRLIDADEERAPVFESEVTVEFASPTDFIEQIFFSANVVFPEPGEYRLQLFGAGEFLRERRLFVIEAEPPEGRPTAPESEEG
jgi:hypothetical protein